VEHGILPVSIKLISPCLKGDEKSLTSVIKGNGTNLIGYGSVTKETRYKYKRQMTRK
jgi:hypothetical protein